MMKRCVMCGAEREASDLAFYSEKDGWTLALCHGAFDSSPTCYEQFPPSRPRPSYLRELL